MKSFMLTLLICSATMSVLALLYMAATPLLARRYSAGSCYYTWLILLIGLIIPFRPQFGSAIVRVDMPDNMNVPVVRIGNAAPVTAAVPNTLLSPSANIAWWQAAAAVWLVGMVLFLSYHIIRYYRFLKLTAHWSEAVTDEQMLTLFQNLKIQMGISREIDLQICDSIGSPMMTGFANPHILLPRADFAEEELKFILKHELVHYKRKDLWYKCLVLIAAAMHWFNPIVHMMSKAVNLQCELSCDAEVVRSTSADTRLCYSETMIGVIRYKSKLKTVLSTNFYGGKKGMKKRIFSIMDMGNKKTGIAVLCCALLLTLGTGAAFAANTVNTETQNSKVRNPKVQNPEAPQDNLNVVTPWISTAFIPSPDTYGPYASFGITISEDGRKLLYEGQPVRQFVDEKADGWAFYLDGDGNQNLSAVRDDSGRITGIESITAQKAQEYYEDFFAEELEPGVPEEVHEEAFQAPAKDIVKESVQEGGNKYAKYQPFGITYSAADEILYFNGQRVKFFIDQPAGEGADTLWLDHAGTVNLAVIHGISGQITGIESISDEKAQEY